VRFRSATSPGPTPVTPLEKAIEKPAPVNVICREIEEQENHEEE
jgi:hypothetical protein